LLAYRKLSIDDGRELSVRETLVGSDGDELLLVVTRTVAKFDVEALAIGALLNSDTRLASTNVEVT
jgi:hypothetical protein